MRSPAMMMIATLIAACSAEPPPVEVATADALSMQEFESPGADDSALPNLTRAADGAVWMSWVEPGDAGHSLRLARFHQGEWGPVRTAASGEDWFVNWADFPSVLAMDDGGLVAHWLQMEGEGTYAYGIRVVRSNDQGLSWSQAITPHRDGTQTEHGFVSLYPRSSSEVGMVWLDGRNMVAEGMDSGGGHDGHGAGGMTLRHAGLDAEGGLHDEVELDGLTCDCCQTAAAATMDGALVVYRDRSDAEIRDIYRVLHDGTNWSAPAPLHVDGWEIGGCPVNGPSVDVEGNSVVVAWFTAAEQRPRVQLGFSSDGGRSLDHVHELPSPGSVLGRIDVELLPDGRAVALWLSEDADGGALLAQVVSVDGPAAAPTTLARTAAARSSGFPRLQRLSPDTFLVAWTEVSGEGAERRTRVRVGRLSLGG